MKTNQAKSSLHPRLTVFVAYPYSLYRKNSYRRVFASLAKQQNIKFVFADERITNIHILQKIIKLIRTSDFSLFDISGWNPNVTLELGVALTMARNWFICINPKKTPMSDVPSDIRGIDRIQYTSLPQLQKQLRDLLIQFLADPPYSEPVTIKALQNLGTDKHKKRKSDGILVGNISSDFFNQFPVRVEAMANHLDRLYTPENFGTRNWLGVFRRFASEGYFSAANGTSPQRITMKTLLNAGPKLERWLQLKAMTTRSILGLEN